MPEKTVSSQWIESLAIDAITNAKNAKPGETFTIRVTKADSMSGDIVDYTVITGDGVEPVAGETKRINLKIIDLPLD